MKKKIERDAAQSSVKGEVGKGEEEIDSAYLLENTSFGP